MRQGVENLGAARIDLDVGSVELLPEGVAMVRYAQELDVDLPTTLRLHQAFLDLIGPGEQWPVLIDLRPVRGFSREARQASTGPHISPHLAAVAVLQNSPVATVIYNWVVALGRPSFPTRLFHDEAAALAWLRGFVDPSRPDEG